MPRRSCCGCPPASGTARCHVLRPHAGAHIRARTRCAGPCPGGAAAHQRAALPVATSNSGFAAAAAGTACGGAKLARSRMSKVHVRVACAALSCSTASAFYCVRGLRWGALWAELLQLLVSKRCLPRDTRLSETVAALETERCAVGSEGGVWSGRGHLCFRGKVWLLLSCSYFFDLWRGSPLTAAAQSACSGDAESQLRQHSA